MPETKPKELKKSVTVIQIGNAGYRVISSTNFFDIEMNKMLDKAECQELSEKGVTVTVKAAK